MYLYLNAKRRKLWKLIVLENAQVARVHNTILLEYTTLQCISTIHFTGNTK